MSFFLWHALLLLYIKTELSLQTLPRNYWNLVSAGACANRHRMSEHSESNVSWVTGEGWCNKSNWIISPSLSSTYHDTRSLTVILSQSNPCPILTLLHMPLRCSGGLSGESCVRRSTILMFLLTLAGGPIILWSHTEQCNDNNSTPGSYIRLSFRHFHKNPRIHHEYCMCILCSVLSEKLS